MTLFKRPLLLAAFLSTLVLAVTSHAELNPNITIAPNPLTFDSVRPGDTSGPETIRVTNTAAPGGSSIAINDIGLTDETNFRIDLDECSGRTLNPSTFCNAQASFAPAGGRGGYFSGFIVISNETPIGASTLQGQVVAPQVAFLPTSVDFGHQAIGQSSAANAIAMTNTGDASLTITSITTTDPFAVTDDCENTLAVGDSCTISTTFSPAAEGAASGSVSVVTDAQTSPDSVALSGTGVASDQPVASFSTNALDFGGQMVGTESAAQTVELSNTGTVELTVQSITPPAGFATSDDCGNQLSAGATCSINTTFAPNAAQAYSSTISVATNAGDSPHTIAVTGFGANFSGPKAVSSQTSIDFGQQALRKPSNPATTTITSEGTEALIMTSVVKTADSTGSFSGSDNCSGKTLPPGESCTIDVVFNPQEKGTLGATASVSNNAPDSPQTLIATGVGVRISGGNCSLQTSTAFGNTLGAIAFGLFTMAAFFVKKRSRDK